MGSPNEQAVIEECGNTIYRDFTYSRYETRATDSQRLHSGSLLRHLVHLLNVDRTVWPLVQKLKTHLGTDEIIWGVKWTAAGFDSIELYVSSNEEKRPLQLRSIATLRTLLHPWLDEISYPDDLCPTSMFSFDLQPSATERERVSCAHIYVTSNMDERNFCGFSYELGSVAPRFKNHYMRFSGSDKNEVLEQRMSWSPHTPECGIYGMLPKDWLNDSFSIFHAAKPLCDGVYLCRLPLKHTIAFSDAYFPSYVGNALRDHAAGFEHLFWDVGLDYSVAKIAGGGHVLKTAIFGYV
jgi:hypothetical protein